MTVKFLLAVPFALLLLCSSARAGDGSYGPYFYGDCRRDTFGESFKAARDAQILNPDAGSNLQPVAGMDAGAAEAGYKKYVESFSKQTGGSGGAGMGFVPVIGASPGGSK